MTRPRQKWHSEISVGPSLTSNKRLNEINASLATLIGHIRVDSSKNLRIYKGK